MTIAHSPRMQRLDHLKRSKQLDAVILSSASSLKCYSGYWYNFETGASPFHILPGALVMLPQHEYHLILADDQASRAPTVSDAFEVSYYSSYAYEQPLIFLEDFCAKVYSLLSKTSALRKIGIEKNMLPTAVYFFLMKEFPSIEWIDITLDLATLRAVKDEDEVALIREAAGLADKGQQAVVRYSRAGISELELFSSVRLAMESAAGSRIPVMTDLVSGPGTANGGGNPTPKIIGPDDMVLSDLTPCKEGYWGDSCSTIHLGSPTKEQLNIFSMVRDALQIGLEALRPGTEAREVDRRMRDYLANEGGFGHHGGHGVGTQYHEQPRIVPYNTTLLEAGMVIALEPAVYKADYGIRLEHMAVVREDGPELLTAFTHRFTPE